MHLVLLFGQSWIHFWNLGVSCGYFLWGYINDSLFADQLLYYSTNSFCCLGYRVLQSYKRVCIGRLLALLGALHHQIDNNVHSILKLFFDQFSIRHFSFSPNSYVVMFETVHDCMHVTIIIIMILGYKPTCVMCHCKKRWAIFPSPAGMSQTKLSLII